MNKRLAPVALAPLLLAGASLWAVSDRDSSTPAPRGVAQPGAPGPALPGTPQPPGGFPGQPPHGFPVQPPGGQGFPGGSRINYRELVSALIGALNDNDAEVRASVAQALARTGQHAVSPLIEVLKDRKKSKELRANAAYVLGKIGYPAREAIPELTRLLKDPDRELRRRAAFALAHIVGNNAGGFPMGPMMMPGMFGSGTAPARGAVPDPGTLPPGKAGPSTDKEEKPK